MKQTTRQNNESTILWCFFLQFLRKMAQPYDKAGTMGRKTLLTQEDLEKMAETGVQDMAY